VRLDAGSYATFGTTNAGGGGLKGLVNAGGTGTAGTDGASTAKISTTNAGTTITNYAPPVTITSATYDASTNVLAVTGTNMTTGDTIDPTKFDADRRGRQYIHADQLQRHASSATAFS